MATQEKQKNPYHEGGTSTPGFGTGGKFRKPPSRRTQTTPYDRPANSLRNPTTSRNNSGWFSKLVVDPAHKLISNSAHSIFSSLFRRRLPPPPPPAVTANPNPSSSEAKQEVRERDNCQEKAAFVANNSSGMQQGEVGESSNGGGISELEQLLRQKTFTRSEIDHLTELMRSRTVDAPAQEEEERTEVIASEPMLTCDQKEECSKTPALENGIEHRLAVTPYVAPSVPIQDVASPAELAKAYMGSRPSKTSSVMLGVQSPGLRDDATFLKRENFPLKSSMMSIVPRATRHAAVHENGFVTPRSRGRSAIYNMARTPYARVYPTSTLKGGRFAIEGEPSSTTQSTLDHGMQSGSKQGAVKRRSIALDNDLGSVGPIRRVRHKSNLLYSKGVGTDSVQRPSSSVQNPSVLGEVKHNHVKLSEENLDGTSPRMSFPSLPSKSSEMASKILQQLDKLVSPAEKSSESRQPTVNDKSPMKLSPSMLRGQALRSMETVDSSKLLDNIQDNKFDGTPGNSSNSAKKIMSEIDKVENGQLKLDPPSGGSVPVITDADATNPKTQVMSSAKPGDSSMITSVSYPPPKKRAFHMSAHEDFVDLDDDAYLNGNVSSFPHVEKETKSSVAAEKTSRTGAIAQENYSTLSFIRPSKEFTIDGEAHVEAADGSRVGQKVDVSTSITSTIPIPTINPVTIAAGTKTSICSDKPASPNGTIVNTPLFNFGNEVVSSTASGAPSDKIAKSGLIFGLEKVPQIPCTSSAGGESIFPKFGSSNSMVGNLVSSTTANGATDSMPKVPESDKTDTETKRDMAFSVRSSEPAVSSAASTSLWTSSNSVFNFGHSSTSNQNNGSIASNLTFSSPFSSFASNNFTSQNIFGGSSLAPSNSISATAASTGSALTTSTPAIFSSSNSSSSATMVASSSSTTSVFKFGSNPSQSTGLPVSSGSAPQETKSSQDAGVGNLSNTAFGSSSAAGGSLGSGIFGFSSSSMKSLNSPSQGSVIGATASNGSVLGSQVAPAATSGFATSTQTQSVSFGSSASSPSFGLTGSTTFSSGSSMFTTSSLATNTSFSSGSSVFASSSPATNMFNSGSTFGLGTSASTSAANSNGGTSSTLFGTSSWQPNKSPFGSSFSSSSGFSFGASTTSVASTTSSPFGASTSSVASTSSLFGTSTASTPQFSFNSAAATTSTQPAFGSPSPAFAFGATAPVNNDQMSMEDSMAEDMIQASPPAAPIFGQQPAPVQPSFVSAPVQPNFAFGAPAPSGGSPFQFGGQQTPQNPSPFQASGSLEFNAGGGSFSLGTGGGDKGNRRIFKPKHKPRKK